MKCAVCGATATRNCTACDTATCQRHACPECRRAASPEAPFIRALPVAEPTIGESVDRMEKRRRELTERIDGIHEGLRSRSRFGMAREDWERRNRLKAQLSATVAELRLVNAKLKDSRRIFHAERGLIPEASDLRNPDHLLALALRSLRQISKTYGVTNADDERLTDAIHDYLNSLRAKAEGR